MKFIIYLHEQPRTAGQILHGASGKKYRFLFSEEHRRMILDGAELSPERFAEVCEDIFRADSPYAKAVPAMIETKPKEKKPKAKSEPAKTEAAQEPADEPALPVEPEAPAPTPDPEIEV